MRVAADLRMSCMVQSGMFFSMPYLSKANPGTVKEFESLTKFLKNRLNDRNYYAHAYFVHSNKTPLGIRRLRYDPAAAIMSSLALGLLRWARTTSDCSSDVRVNIENSESANGRMTQKASKQ